MIVKYQKEQTVTKLKKAYTTLYSAYRQATFENGNAVTWDYSLGVKDFYSKYLAKYLRGEICSTNVGKCKSYKWKQGITGNYDYTYTPSVILEDGTYISLMYSNGLLLRVDINGQKKPNCYGKDIFNIGIDSYNFTDKRKVYERFGFFCQWCGGASVTSYTKTRASWLSVCRKDYGPNCGGLIQSDGWQIKDDYPW